MAIFGTFNDMPLPDVLSLVGRSSGRFFITDLPTYVDYELNFYDGALIALYINQNPLEDVVDVSHSMVELMRTRIGQFRYERRPPQDLVEYFRLPVDQVLLSSLVVADEIDSLRPFLPNEKTVFVCTENTEKWMDEDLRNFYETSYQLLIEGASGEVIARETGQYLDQVLFCLYKLRSAGLICPCRANSRNMSAAPAMSALAPVATASVSPSGSTAVHQEPEAGLVVATASVSPDGPSADLRNVKIQRPPRGFFSRIISKLTATLSGHNA
ncbi:MAG: DUF4388 domain-containing protein [Candidatus Methylacidiphilales bacterium]|nr:DUF4388 domain-containing protein [Candidatus Methylacidiphilales bacterium]